MQNSDPGSLLTLGAGGGGGAVQLNLLLILACAGVITLLLSRLRVAAIPAYLLAGVAIGPSGLGLVGSPEGIEQIGQMALIVLMFSIGMHLDASAVRRGAGSILLVGVLSTLAGVAAMWGVLTLCGMSPRGALAAAMGLSMSSTAVVMRLYTQRRQLQSASGRATLGILLVQDLL
ncbi:MAG: cation:proton antiporter, partial [Planctomycetota bacterium]